MKKYRDAKQIGKYLAVVQYNPAGRKTNYYTVYGENRVSLGNISWYAPWRQYTFNPYSGTTFHAGCLTDLATFLAQLNKEHREAVAARRTKKEKKS